MTAIIDNYFSVKQNQRKWVKVRDYLRREITFEKPNLQISELSYAYQKRMILRVSSKWKPNTIKGIMRLLNATVRHACKEDDNRNIFSAHCPPVMSSVSEICEFLEVPEPKPDNWCPGMEGMAQVLKIIQHHEPSRRWAILAIYSGGRSSAVANAAIDQFETSFDETTFNLLKKDEIATSKRRSRIPVIDMVMDEVRSWGPGPWIGAADTVAGYIQNARDELNMPLLKPSSFRDFTTSVLKNAHKRFGVERVWREERMVWLGHAAENVVHEDYGGMDADYLESAAIAMQACMLDLDRRSGGAIFRRVTAERPVSEGSGNATAGHSNGRQKPTACHSDSDHAQVDQGDDKPSKFKALSQALLPPAPLLRPLLATGFANPAELERSFETVDLGGRSEPLPVHREEHGRDSFPREEAVLNDGSRVKTGLDGAISAFFRRVTDDPIDKILLYENAFALTEADQIGEIRAIGIIVGRSGCSSELCCYLQENREYTIFDTFTKSAIDDVKLVDFTNTYCVKGTKSAVHAHGAYSEKSDDIDDNAIFELGYKLRKQTLAGRSLENKILEKIQQIEMSYFK